LSYAWIGGRVLCLAGPLEGNVNPTFCPICQTLIAPDGDGRMPPWCPCCGADVKRGAPASDPNEPQQKELDEEAPAVPAAELPLVLPADPPYAQPGGYRPFTEDEHPAKPGSSSAARIAAAVCTAIGVGLALAIAPRVFPQAEGEFSVPQVVLAAVLGAVGGAVGWLVGQLIDATRR